MNDHEGRFEVEKGLFRWALAPFLPPAATRAKAAILGPATRCMADRSAE